VYPGGGSLPRRQLDGWQDWAKQRGAKGLAYVLVAEDGTLSGPVAKNISEPEKAGLVAAAGANPGDAIFFAAGEANASRALLGAARNEIAERTGLIEDGDWAFVWVVDAPLFESAADPQAAGHGAGGAGRNEIAERTGLIEDGDWAFVWVVDAPLFESAADAQAAGDVAVGEGAWTAVHHAFTAPKPEFLDTLESDPGAALAYAYDIVC